MEVLVVTFGLDQISEAEYYRSCDAEAPAFADIPGLIAKVWIADPGSNTYGGIYTFEDAAAVDAYVSSDLFKSIGETPEFVGMTVRRFAVIEGATRITHGWAEQSQTA